MRIQTKHIIGILIGVGVIAFSFIFLYSLKSRFFKPLIALGIFVGIFQFWIDSIKENSRQNEMESKFLEFAKSQKNSN